MKRVNVVVEGQTEETFVHEVLGPHLAGFDVALTARRVEFSRRQARIYRGGLLEYPKLKKDIVNWLNQDREAVVTTMVDLYALPSDFPGRAEGDKLCDPQKRVLCLQDAFRRDVDSVRFVPHIQLHEFEAILFTDIAQLAAYYPAYGNGIARLVESAAQFASPELIDEGKTTSPSKRILREVPIYDKVIAGCVIALKLGLPAIRAKCPHFSAWVAGMEQLGQAPI